MRSIIDIKAGLMKLFLKRRGIRFTETLLMFSKRFQLRYTVCDPLLCDFAWTSSFKSNLNQNLETRLQKCTSVSLYLSDQLGF